MGSFQRNDRTGGAGSSLKYLADGVSEIRGSLNHERLASNQRLLDLLSPTAQPNQLHLRDPVSELFSTTLLSPPHSQRIGLASKTPDHSVHRPSQRGRELTVFPEPSLEDSSSKLRLLPQRFGAPILTAVTLLSHFLARESKALGNCLLRSPLEPAAVLYSYCAPSTSARHLPRQPRGPS